MRRDNSSARGLLMDLVGIILLEGIISIQSAFRGLSTS